MEGGSSSPQPTGSEKGKKMGMKEGLLWGWVFELSDPKNDKSGQKNMRVFVIGSQKKSLLMDRIKNNLRLGSGANVCSDAMDKKIEQNFGELTGGTIPSSHWQGRFPGRMEGEPHAPAAGGRECRATVGTTGRSRTAGWAGGGGGGVFILRLRALQRAPLCECVHCEDMVTGINNTALEYF